MMLRKSSPPIEPRRFEAPMTATAAGAKNGRSEAATATWSRCFYAREKPRRLRDREAHLDFAATERPRELEAGVVEYCEHRGVLGQHFCDELLDAMLGRARCELLEQSRRGAAPLDAHRRP